MKPLLVINSILLLTAVLFTMYEHYNEYPLTGWVYDYVVEKLPDYKSKFVKIEE